MKVVDGSGQTLGPEARGELCVRGHSRMREYFNDPGATKAAIDGSCPLCLQTTRLFISLYGAEAGNLALKYCATAGVWLGGSIAESLYPHFSAKGPPRIREMLAKIPIHLIKFELNGLYGAANFAAAL